VQTCSATIKVPWGEGAGLFIRCQKPPSHTGPHEAWQGKTKREWPRNGVAGAGPNVKPFPRR
jgi:hypothetical protein